MLGYLIGAAAATVASAAGYQSMAPAGQWLGRTFKGLKRPSKQLSLTYDDGPNDPHTLRLLEVLAKHNVRATFFLIGRYLQQRPDIARELVKAGHVIGNHTFTHPLLTFKSTRELRTQLVGCERALTDAVGTDRSYTVTATDRLISRFKSEGYELVTIPEMMGKVGVRPQSSAKITV